MIKIPTTLILGAGASAHLGYPLGLQLIDRIARFSRNPDGLGRIIPFPGEQVSKFISTLSMSGHYSIDTFLEENKSFIDIGKYMLVEVLKENELVDKLFPPNPSGWYQYFFNSLLGKNLEDIIRNEISVVTFNYDRSLECYLSNALQNRYGITEKESCDVLKALSIIHIHGILGDFPQIPYTRLHTSDESHNLKLRISQSIKIISEMPSTATGFCSREYELANAALERSQRIFFLGFGFHEDNIKRFNFFRKDTVDRRDVLATLANVGQAQKNELIKTMSPYGLDSVISKAIDHNCTGFFSHVARFN